MYERLKKEKKQPVFLKDRIKKLLLENEEEALFSKELATIRTDAPVSPTFDELRYAGLPVDSVAAIFRKFHFPSLLSRLEDQQPKKVEAQVPEVPYIERPDGIVVHDE